MVNDIVLTYTEYRVLNALNKKNLDLMSNGDYKKFCEIQTAIGLKGLECPFYGFAEIYLFKILNRKLKLKEERFRYYMLRLNEKSCVYGEYYQITSIGQDALENYNRQTQSNRIALFISIAAVLLSLAAILVPLFLNCV